MNETPAAINLDNLPFFVTAPGQTDGLFVAVTISMILVVIGFGALYFTIQAIPDRLASGASKVQLQIVGILGLLSLFTLNNVFWIAALLLAAIRIPDIVTPLKDIAKSLSDHGQEKRPKRKPVKKKQPQGEGVEGEAE